MFVNDPQQYVSTSLVCHLRCVLAGQLRMIATSYDNLSRVSSFHLLRYGRQITAAMISVVLTARLMAKSDGPTV